MMMDHIFIENDKEDKREQIDKDNVDAFIRVLVVLEADRLIGTKQDHCWLCT